MYPTTLPHHLRTTLWPRIHGYELGPHRLELCKRRQGRDYAAFRLTCAGWQLVALSHDYDLVSQAFDREVKRLWH